MEYITLNVNNQKVTLDKQNSVDLLDTTLGYYKLRFKFESDNWAELTKYAAISNKDVQRKVELIQVDDYFECDVPNEISSNIMSRFMVGVAGYNTNLEQRYTTDSVLITLKKGCEVGAEVFESSQLDEFEKLIVKFNRFKEDLNSDFNAYKSELNEFVDDIEEDNVQFKDMISASQEAFKSAMTQAVDIIANDNNQFKENAVQAQDEFEESMTSANNQFKSDMTTTNNKFKSDVVKDQDEFKVDMQTIIEGLSKCYINDLGELIIGE